MPNLIFEKLMFNLLNDGNNLNAAAAKTASIIKISEFSLPARCEKITIRQGKIFIKVKSSMLCVSGGYNPDIHLFTQSKGLVKWDKNISRRRLGRNSILQRYRKRNTLQK